VSFVSGKVINIQCDRERELQSLMLLKNSRMQIDSLTAQKEELPTEVHANSAFFFDILL